MKSVNPYLRNAPSDPALLATAKTLQMSRFAAVGLYTTLVVFAARANDSFRFSSPHGEPLSAEAIAMSVTGHAEERKVVLQFLEEGVSNGLFAMQGGFYSLPRSSAIGGKARQ